jgi:hypothetical protein
MNPHGKSRTASKLDNQKMEWLDMTDCIDNTTINHKIGGLPLTKLHGNRSFGVAKNGL